MRIVVFGSKTEWERYRPNDFVAAYYRSGGSVGTIVLGSAAVEAFPVAVHEYVHLVVDKSGLQLPVWLSEGLAELYSTLQPRGGQMMVGTVIPGRLHALQVEKWVPLATILAADRNSPYYNDKNKAGGLYNESWALAHMLNLGEDYRPLFPKLMDAIESGQNSRQALERVYAKPLARIENDLQGYLRGSSFQAAPVSGQAEPGC